MNKPLLTRLRSIINNIDWDKWWLDKIYRINVTETTRKEVEK